MGKYSRIKESTTRIFETVVGQLVAALIIAAVIAYFSWDLILPPAKYVLSVLSQMKQIDVPLWMTLLVIGAIILLILLSKFLPKKNPAIRFPVAFFRRRNGNETKIPFTDNGIKWIVYIPNQLFGSDEYVWVDGPFCPACNLELKWDDLRIKSWHCNRCDKKFKSRMKTEHDEKEYVENIARADIFTNKKFKQN